MSKAVGIIDEPVAPGATDNLDINIHSKSLIDFISDTSTPITVGIQGEWGSGKTSLINSIHHSFDSHGDIKQIWINSWEYSLLSTPEEALLKIVNRIIDDLVAQDTNKKRLSSIKSGAESIFKGALRVGAGMTMGMEAANVAKELLETSEQTISALRQQLSDVVNESKFKKIIIYVDDLDRIEPRNAVAILELLKNIFSVPRCVFILAIDYQVVVKGLEHKFGKQTAENEWEFRAFFDKIIQLPFMMPMGQYNIGKYVNALLVDIGFVEAPGLDDEAVREIVLRTIGGNPRSIKRLANSVSLIQIFVKNKDEIEGNKSINADEDDDTKITIEEERFLIFSLLCLQIAYPAIYSFLVQKPDFPNWEDNDAFSETKRSEEDDEKLFSREFENAKKTEDFNEEWEQALYRVCYIRPRLKPRAADISKFFSYLKDELLSDRRELIGEIVAELLTKTSVTSVTSTDQGQEIPQSRSKWATDEQVENLSLFRNDYLTALKGAGSSVFGSRNPGKSFAWYMRFKAKKNSFSDPKFTPRWEIGFFDKLAIRVDGKNVDDNQKLIEFFIANKDRLERELPPEDGEWQFKSDDGVFRKFIRFGFNLPKKGGLLDREGIDLNKFINEKGKVSHSMFAEDAKVRELTINYCIRVVPIFEKIVIELIEEFILQNGKILTSTVAYGG